MIYIYDVTIHDCQFSDESFNNLKFQKATAASRHVCIQVRSIRVPFEELALNQGLDPLLDQIA